MSSFISLWLIHLAMTHQSSTVINISHLAMTQRSSRLFWWFVVHVTYLSSIATLSSLTPCHVILSQVMINVRVLTRLKDHILKESVNNSLREIHILTIRLNIVIVLNWISTKKNVLTNALSRFDSNKIANMCSHWQILLTSVNLLSSIILSSSTWSSYSTMTIESKSLFDTI
jgi:hypothetical protein